MISFISEKEFFDGKASGFSGDTVPPGAYLITGLDENTIRRSRQELIQELESRLEERTRLPGDASASYADSGNTLTPGEPLRFPP